MSTRSLLAERSTLTDELRSIHATAPDGALSESAEARFAVLKTSLTAIDGRVERQALMDEMDRRAAGSPVPGGDNRLDAEIRNFSLVRAIAGAAGLDVDDGREREISKELARRSGRTFQGIAVPLAALSGPVEQRVFTAAGSGSNMISTDYRPDLFIDKLWASMQVRALGAAVLSGLVGNLTIPRLSVASTAGWVADNTALIASDPTIQQVAMSPKSAGAITEYSRLLLLQTSPDVETMLRNSMATVLAQALDSAAISGTGTAPLPRGVLNTSGIGSVAIGTNGGALSLDNVTDLIASVANVNAEMGKFAFLSNTKVRAAAAKLKDTQNRPYGLPLVFQNIPTAWSNNVPFNGIKGTGTALSSLIYGNWSDMLIGVWSELDLLVNPFESTAYSKGSVQVRAMMSVDIATRHPESFGAITDIVA